MVLKPEQEAKPKLRLVWVNPNELKVYSGNTKIHPPEQIKLLVRSIHKNRFLNLIIDDGKDIIDGPHRFRVMAELLGPAKAPPFQTDHLMPVNEMAYPFTENAKWKGGNHGFKR